MGAFKWLITNEYTVFDVSPHHLGLTEYSVYGRYTNLPMDYGMIPVERPPGQTDLLSASTLYIPMIVEVDKAAKENYPCSALPV